MERDGNCVFVIADSGSGIEPRNLSKIFDPFFTNKDKVSVSGFNHAVFLY